MTAARRLAAILAADVAGYARLMGEDEAGTAKIVRERREAVTPAPHDHGLETCRYRTTRAARRLAADVVATPAP